MRLDPANSLHRSGEIDLLSSSFLAPNAAADEELRCPVNSS